MRILPKILRLQSHPALTDGPGSPAGAGTASRSHGPVGSHRAITAAIVLLALAGVLLVLLDWREVRDVLVRANWQWLPLTLVFTTISYLCLSYSFALINRSFRIPLPQRALLWVGFVSSAMIAAVGGLAGHSLRLLLMTRRGLSASDVMAPSLFHSYLESLIFFALIPAGLIYLLLTHPLSSSLAAWLSIGAGILGVAFAITAVVFFFGPARTLALGVLAAFWRLVIRRDIRAALQRFDSTLSEGLEELRSRPQVLVLPVLLVLADRLVRVVVVWLCFQALGSEVGLGVTVTGFSLGVAVGVMSMVPGGIGVQEGSMAGTYHLLGVPLEEAVLASILFRAVYYTAPFGISLLFYRRMLRAGELSPT